MVTTRRAEGFSPRTTKGTEPPASVDANVICHIVGGVGGRCSVDVAFFLLRCCFFNVGGRYTTYKTP